MEELLLRKSHATATISSHLLIISHCNINSNVILIMRLIQIGKLYAYKIRIPNSTSNLDTFHIRKQHFYSLLSNCFKDLRCLELKRSGQKVILVENGNQLGFPTPYCAKICRSIRNCFSHMYLKSLYRSRAGRCLQQSNTQSYTILALKKNPKIQKNVKKNSKKTFFL